MLKASTSIPEESPQSCSVYEEVNNLVTVFTIVQFSGIPVIFNIFIFVTLFISREIPIFKNIISRNIIHIRQFTPNCVI